MSDNKFSSPLLQRLKKIQTSQEKCSDVSNLYLSNLRGPSTSPLSLNEDSKLLSSSSRESMEEVVLDERACVKHLPRNTRIDSLTIISEKENVNPDQPVSVGGPKFPYLNPDQNVSVDGPKFPYLKKGQGLFRFRSKTFKGFKKKNKQPKILKTSIEEVKPSCHQAMSKNNFEKLEQLVNNDSFCSTSSKVVNLMQDDESSTLCSSPISVRLSFTTTPVFNTRQNIYGTERGFQIQSRTSPVRKLFPTAIVSSSINENCMIKHVQEANETDSTLRSMESFPIRSNYPGILKKRDQNVSIVSPSSLKVQFLEKGVKVLEYDDDEQLNNTNLSDDTTDLVGESDLDWLARLNFNVVYENSPPAKTSKTQTNFTATSSSKYVVSQASSLSTSVTHYNEAKDKSNSKIDLPANLVNSSEDKCDDIKVHKLLLLSKVNDLDKEINIFKNNNKLIEELYQELENEKQKLINCQCVPDQIEQGTKPKIRTKNPLSNSQKKEFVTEVEHRLQDLNKKISGLEVENNNLKRKVVSLERREKEMRKKQNENINSNSGTSLNLGCSKFQNENLEKKKICTKNYKNLKKTPFPNVPKAKRTNNFTKDEKCLGKQGTSKLKPENNETEIPLSENSDDDQILQEEPTDRYSNNKDNSNKEQKVLVESGEIRCNEEKRVFSTEFERIELETDVRLKLNDKTLFTIPEEELLACSLRRRSASDETSTKVSLGESPKRKGCEYPHPLPVKMPFSIPDDSIEIVDVVGRNISLPDELNQVEEILNMVSYHNGDKELIYPHKKVYRYSSNGCVQAIFEDREEMVFPNGQREIYYKNGTYQIYFPDNSSKSVFEDGTEMSVCTDGTEIRVTSSGLKTILFSNGQTEIHENNGIRRIYPDGTTKTLFKDGSQETRYRNGRIRRKDAEGNVTMH